MCRQRGACWSSAIPQAGDAARTEIGQGGATRDAIASIVADLACVSKPLRLFETVAAVAVLPVFRAGETTASGAPPSARMYAIFGRGRKFLILNELYFFADRFDESSVCMLGHKRGLFCGVRSPYRRTEMSSRSVRLRLSELA